MVYFHLDQASETIAIFIVYSTQGFPVILSYYLPNPPAGSESLSRMQQFVDKYPQIFKVIGKVRVDPIHSHLKKTKKNQWYRNLD